jgi:cell division protein ZapA
LQFASKVTQKTINEDSLSDETAARLQKLAALLDESLT